MSILTTNIKALSSQGQSRSAKLVKKALFDLVFETRKLGSARLAKKSVRLGLPKRRLEYISRYYILFIIEFYLVYKYHRTSKIMGKIVTYGCGRLGFFKR